MDQIYKNAFKTVIWLGKETNKTRRAAQIFRGSRDAAERAVYRALELQEAGSYANPLDADTYKPYGMPPVTRADWDCIIDIYSRRWFCRVWVMQEVALSREPEVWCGDIPIPWEDICILATFFGVTNILVSLMQVCPSPHYLRGARGIGCAASLYFVREVCKGRSSKLSGSLANMRLGMGMRGQIPESLLVTLIFLSYPLEATKYRDKIYALHGMLKHLCGSTDIQADLSPNYQLCQDADVFEKVGKAILRESNSLHLITLGGSNPGRNVTGLPSWLPDFTNDSHPNPMLGPNYKPTRPLDAPGCSSSTGSRARIEGNKLHVRGFRLGTVSSLGETWRDMRHKRFYDCFDMLLQIDPVYRYTGQPRLEAFWRTMILDMEFSVRPASANTGSDFKDYIMFYLSSKVEDDIDSGIDEKTAIDSLQSMGVLAGDGSGPLPSLEQVMQTAFRIHELRSTGAPQAVPEYLGPLLFQGALRFETHFLYAMVFRRPFAMDSGHLACGPEWTQAGDEVWVISGCPTPLILLADFEAHMMPDETCGRYIGRGVRHGEESVHWREMNADEKTVIDFQVNRLAGHFKPLIGKEDEKAIEGYHARATTETGDSSASDSNATHSLDTAYKRCLDQFREAAGTTSGGSYDIVDLPDQIGSLLKQSLWRNGYGVAELGIDFRVKHGFRPPSTGYRLRKQGMYGFWKTWKAGIVKVESILMG
ncbi:hypothetical protein DL765_001899 [Monosporascus sp. GIB2]|nr:hypothetical protein DL765_001899 [Monosporascus sp. GIB2]